jgi:hypothetical protein
MQALSPHYAEEWHGVALDVDDWLARAIVAVRQGVLTSDERFLQEIGATDPRTNGAGTVSAVAAIFLASRYAADPATGIRVAAFQKGLDTDTVASMTGALLATMLGDAWIKPAWREVQDAEFFPKLMTNLFLSSGHGSVTINESRWSEGDSKRVVAALRHNEKHVHLGPLGEARVVAKDYLKTVGSLRESTRFALRTEIGQTLFVIDRGSTNAARKPSKVGKERTKALAPTSQHGGSPAEINTKVTAAHRTVRDRMVGELDLLMTTLPVDYSAHDLLQSLTIALSSLENLRINTPGANVSSEKLLSELRNELIAHHMPDFPDEIVLALGRFAWRLGYV